MERVKVRFDRVVDIVRNSRRVKGYEYKSTRFAFESNGRRFPDLLVPDWPRIEAGMTVVALLKKAGDWNSFLGWVDCADGSVVYASMASIDSFDHAGLSLSATMVYFILSLSMLVPYFQNQNVAALVFGCGFEFFALLGLYKFVERRRMRRVLLQIRDDVLKQLAKKRFPHR